MRVNSKGPLLKHAQHRTNVKGNGRTAKRILNQAQGGSEQSASRSGSFTLCNCQQNPLDTTVDQPLRRCGLCALRRINP
jgi:hypothetical protein